MPTGCKRAKEIAERSIREKSRNIEWIGSDPETGRRKSMKLTRIGQGLIAAAACLGIGLGITSCNPGDTIDYLFVTSNSGTGANSGIVTS
jgi:hypothetical protein